MKPLCDVGTDYDIEALVRSGKKEFTKSILLIALYALLLLGSALVVAFWHSCLPAFIIGVLVGCVMLFLLLREIKRLRFSDYNRFVGEIEAVHKEVKTVPTGKVGGINPFGVRKYDQDAKKEIRLIILINDEKRVRTYYLNDVTEEHAAYYEAKGKAVHIWGTHFPVRLDACEGKWLCPVCGEFGVSGGEKTCARCKRKVLK